MLQLVKFGVTGVVSVGLILGLTSLGVALHVEPHAAYIVALVTAVGLNFASCRYFVFRTTAKPVAGEFIRFVASVGFWRVFEFLGFVLLYDSFNFGYQTSMASMAALMVGVKFLWCRFFVFGAPESR